MTGALGAQAEAASHRSFTVSCWERRASLSEGSGGQEEAWTAEGGPLQPQHPKLGFLQGIPVIPVFVIAIFIVIIDIISSSNSLPSCGLL